jgi:formate hydrogenlyase subunit 3/multisubunit Na+/H+ antiporter MnhD subunit
VSAPILWIAVPLVIGALALLAFSERAAGLIGGVTCLVLAVVALVIPIDEALLVGPFSLKIQSTASLLGRNLVISASQAPLLVMLFGLCAIWFLGAEAAGVARRLVPAGMMITAFMVASLAVRPFLYAALLIEMAALAAIPLLAPQGRPPGKAVIKFLIYQTLGMPCILLAGWLLAGVETSPGDLSLTIQATITLSLGFAFLLAVFPLNDWIPGLMAESHPYLTGFLLWLLPNIIFVFGLSFLDSYAWLRTSPDTIAGLRILGLIMLVSSGLWAALERHLGRMMGHAVIAETGLLFLATSLAATSAADTIFPFIIPRGLGIALWALALAIVQQAHTDLDLESLRGVGQTHPWAGAGLVLAALSAAGFPLLAGFPPRIDVWDGLAEVSGPAAIWFLVGVAGLMIGAVRQVALLVGGRRQERDVPQETWLQRGMLGAGMLALVVLGLFPGATGFLIARLPLMFEHLAR